MRKIIILIGILFLIINTQAQNNFMEYGIERSLTSFVVKLKENQERGIVTSNYFDDLYFSIDNYPPHYPFRDSVFDIPVKYISLINYSEYDKFLKKGIWVVSMNNLELSDNKLTITYTLRKVLLKKKNQLSIDLSDSASFTYKYSCDNNEWKLINEEYSGV